MIFRQLFDTNSSTYTYLLGCEDTREAIIIDPVFEQYARDSALAQSPMEVLRDGQEGLGPSAAAFSTG